MTPSAALIIATLFSASCSHFHKLFHRETTSPPNEPRRAEHKGSTNHMLQQRVYGNKWFIQGWTIVLHFGGSLTFFQMNKSGFHRLITIWPYLLDRWCLFQAASFHRRWEVWGAPLPSGSRCLPARTNHGSWGKNFTVFHPPSVAHEKTCRKLWILEEKKNKEGNCTDPQLRRLERRHTTLVPFTDSSLTVQKLEGSRGNGIAWRDTVHWNKTSQIRPGWTDLVESWRLTHLVPLGIELSHQRCLPRQRPPRRTLPFGDSSHFVGRIHKGTPCLGCSFLSCERLKKGFTRMELLRSIKWFSPPLFRVLLTSCPTSPCLQGSRSSPSWPWWSAWRQADVQFQLSLTFCRTDIRRPIWCLPGPNENQPGSITKRAASKLGLFFSLSVSKFIQENPFQFFTFVESRSHAEERLYSLFIWS